MGWWYVVCGLAGFGAAKVASDFMGNTLFAYLIMVVVCLVAIHKVGEELDNK